MTALPQPLGHLLTVAEYAELGETESGYTELLEGRLLMSPSPVPDHNFAGLALAIQLRPQLPIHLEVIPDVDVDLELADPDQPGFARRPASSPPPSRSRSACSWANCSDEPQQCATEYTPDLR